MKLILVRHGETPYNIKKIMQGQAHGELSALGREQADKLGKRLSKMSIDHIYCSDLGRAKQTADEILKHTKAPIEYVEDIREKNCGGYEGKSYSGFERDLLNSPDMMNFKPKDGESTNEVNERVLSFLTEIEKKHKNQTVLLVMHGGPIANFLLQILKDKKFEEVIPPNCAVSIIEKQEDNDYKVELLNCTEHLS
tara:strand:- start:1698 stop:2282 length:585 start_codon:yes stop_codon:yes gene_type:complete